MESSNEIQIAQSTLKKPSQAPEDGQTKTKDNHNESEQKIKAKK